MKGYRGGSLLLVLCLLLAAANAPAQTTVSTIEGTIKDAQGSMVAGAQVVVKSAALGIERTTTSDASGFYRVTALPAGQLLNVRFAHRFCDARLRQHRVDRQ